MLEPARGSMSLRSSLRTQKQRVLLRTAGAEALGAAVPRGAAGRPGVGRPCRAVRPAAGGDRPPRTGRHSAAGSRPLPGHLDGAVRCGVRCKIFQKRNSRNQTRGSNPMSQAGAGPLPGHLGSDVRCGVRSATHADVSHSRVMTSRHRLQPVVCTCSYDGEHLSRTGGRSDGCATFW